MEALILSFFTVVSTTLGGLVSFRHRERLHFIMSFTAGVLLAVSMLDIIPEGLSIVTKNNLDINFLMIPLVVGYLAFHILEKSVLIHHAHEHEYADHKHPSVGLVGALGLSFHSFLDGVGIGLGFQVSSHVGILVGIAVIAHDFSDGLNTVTLMLTHKNTMRKAFALLALDAFAPIFGVLSTFLFQIPEQSLVIYLGFFAGFLLYIGASDLLPEAHNKKSSFKMLGLTILGTLFIFLVTRLT